MSAYFCAVDAAQRAAHSNAKYVSILTTDQSANIGSQRQAELSAYVCPHEHSLNTAINAALCTAHGRAQRTAVHPTQFAANIGAVRTAQCVAFISALRTTQH